ncbi:hypothetical protein [Streptomyces sp. CCM_MD2014]|uniref:hypothetical protein n=1 Tax=Streptomyces sp. CCM_MD2014 TaxID=1561022 RepID=UPI00052A80E9|nr:hypothetical protein [Streptomyces sp. CCM_MD2014]AIV35589.1 hypothetical protein NI25_20520 [Streptomyces sp. CCM_MD2014]
MFVETFIHAGGVAEGHASEAHALQLIRRAFRRGHTVDATPEGGAVITWTARRLVDGEAVEQGRSISFTPQTPAGPLTDAVRGHLFTLHTGAAAFPGRLDGRPVIRAGLQTIPPAATSHLYAHRLVTEDGGRVRLTLVARLALLSILTAASPEDLAAIAETDGVELPA